MFPYRFGQRLGLLMRAGTLIGNKYRLESLLGRGGMGTVWRAEHTGFQASVAVKLMDPPSADGSAEALARFQREAHSAACLRSRNVVQVLDHGVDEESGQPFIVMELLEGETLGARLERDGPLGLSATALIVDQVCRALSRAHQENIVHRDLKPENIFLVRDHDEEYVKVLDFGVAKADKYHVDARTRTGSLLGTPFYMSPEQIVGARDVDARSDLWSLGVITCLCVTGRRPFERETFGALTLAICAEPIPRASELGASSPSFDDWLARALSRDVEARFQTASELAQALNAACVASPIVAAVPVSGGGAALAEAAPVTSSIDTGPTLHGPGRGAPKPAVTQGPVSVSVEPAPAPSLRKRAGRWGVGALVAGASLSAIVGWIALSDATRADAEVPAPGAMVPKDTNARSPQPKVSSRPSEPPHTPRVQGGTTTVDTASSEPAVLPASPPAPAPAPAKNIGAVPAVKAVPVAKVSRAPEPPIVAAPAPRQPLRPQPKKRPTVPAAEPSLSKRPPTTPKYSIDDVLDQRK